MEKIIHTQESVWAAFAETDRKMAETDRLIKEMRDATAKSSAEFNLRMAESDRSIKEMRDATAKSSAESDRRKAEIDLLMAENARRMAKTDRQIKQLGKMIGGLSRNHGLFAEEYFFNSFKRGNKNFFGEQFDKVVRSEILDEDRIKAEFDLLLINGKSVALIEVKYRTKAKTIDRLLNKVKYFRRKFPEYQNHQLFLGVASMVFEEQMENECLDHGIAVIKQVGEAVVIHDENIRTF